MKKLFIPSTRSDACEYCDGIVRENIVEREVFRHRKGMVIFEHVPVGVCDKCGERYYSAEVLHKVHNKSLTGRYYSTTFR